MSGSEMTNYVIRTASLWLLLLLYNHISRVQSSQTLDVPKCVQGSYICIHLYIYIHIHICICFYLHVCQTSCEQFFKVGSL